MKKAIEPHKKELAELAKVELNKAAQAIQTYLKDPNASKAAQQYGAEQSSKTRRNSDAAAMEDDKAKTQKKQKREKENANKHKSTPLVQDDEDADGRPAEEDHKEPVTPSKSTKSSSSTPKSSTKSPKRAVKAKKQ